MPRHISTDYDSWLTNDGSHYCIQCDCLYTGTQHDCEEVAAALAAQDRRQAEADLHDAMVEVNEKLRKALNDFSAVCDEIKKRFT